MQGENFTLPDRERVPSVFSSMLLFFIALMGRIITPYLMVPVGFVLRLLVIGITEEFTASFAQVLYYTLFLILPLAVCFDRYPGMHEYIRIKPLSGSLSVLCVLAAVAGMFFITYLGYFWLIPLETLFGSLPDTGVMIPDTVGGMMGAILVDAIMPGVCEELLFRGALLSAWEEKGSKKALVIVSILFACMHTSITGIPSEFLSGLILAFIVISTDSLFAGMIYHTIHNAVILLFSYALQSPDTVSEAEKLTLFTTVGGLGGMIELLFMAAVWGGILYFLLRRIDSGRGERRFGLVPANRREWTVQETVLLLCCGIVCVILYALDFMSLLGVLV